MEKVNYIVQLNAVFELFNRDVRIKQGHITLYLAFFQKWNRKYFESTLTINRASIMERAKFKSKTTYHNYLKDLNDWGYLKYFPSFHPARGSIIKMSKFGTTTGTTTGTPTSTSTVQKMASSVPEPGQNLVPSLKHKTNENFNKLAKPKNELAVLDFFNKNNWPAIEGKKILCVLSIKKLETEQRTHIKIKNWKKAANNFVENSFKIKQESTSPISGYVDNLRKNYDESL